MEQNWQNLIDLMACALNGVTPEKKKTEQMDKAELLSMAKAHSLTGLVAMSLYELGEMLSEEWKQEKEKAIRRSILMDAEYQRIAVELEQHQIWYVPLKGRILQEYYPKKGMRQMADIDILFDEAYRERVKQLFLEWGYHVKGYGNSNHDVYMKAPVYNFEMHVSLYGDSHESVFSEYYSNIKDRLNKVREDGLEYCFTDEDFYIYVLSHSYKHYSGGGTGLRTLADQYVYLRAKEPEMDWNYIRAELEKLGLDEFEIQSRELCKKLFTQGTEEELSEKEQEYFNYYCSSSTYGTMQHRVENDLKKIEKRGKKNAKTEYLLKRIFPEISTLEAYCPVAKKYRFLLVYAWGKRVFRACTTRRKGVTQELKYISTANTQKKSAR